MNLLGVDWACSPAKNSLLRPELGRVPTGMGLWGANRCSKLNGYVSNTNWVLNQSCLIEM